MRIAKSELYYAYLGRFDLKYPLIVTLNPTPEEQKMDLSMHIAELDVATFQRIVDRVNEDVPKTPVSEESDPEHNDAKLIPAGAQVKYSCSVLFARKDGTVNAGLNADQLCGAELRLYLDHCMDYAMKMRKISMAAAAAQK